MNNQPPTCDNCHEAKWGICISEHGALCTTCRKAVQAMETSELETLAANETAPLVVVKLAQRVLETRDMVWEDEAETEYVNEWDSDWQALRRTYRPSILRTIN